MSRSFYVDSLIVKEPSSMSKPCNSVSVSTDSPIATLSPTRASPPSGLQTLHPVPCYPRHHGDFLNLCCPLCLPTAQTAHQIFADRTVKQIIPTPASNSLSFTPASTASPETRIKESVFQSIGGSPFKLSSVCSEKRLAGLGDISPPRHTTTATSEQRRIRYGTIGR